MPRSKRYQEQAKKIDATKKYSIEQAIPLLKETATVKFDGSVEAHIRLGINVTKGDQQVRGTVTLPHGSGKTLKIAVFASGDQAKIAKEAGAEIVGDEALIKEIAQTGKVNFDIAVATPDMMRVMAQVAKVLGPKGLMPSPKNETVTTDIKKTVEALRKGKLSFKNDATGNVHMTVGRVSFGEAQLVENFNTAIEAIRKAKPASSKGTYMKNVSINSTMGSGITISIA